MIGYYDYYSREERRRIEFLLAGSGEFIRLLRPAWGADPAPGSNYVRIADGALTISEPGEAGFDKIIAGPEKTSSQTITIDFRLFHTDRFGNPSSTHQALGDGIRNYVAADAGTISFGAYSRTFDTMNLVTIYTDEGDSTRAMSAFTVRFQGVQRKIPVKKGDVHPGDTVTQEHELYSSVRAVLDELRMRDVCTYLRAEYDPFSTEFNGDTYNVAIEQVWDQSGGGRAAWLHYTGNAHTETKYYRFVDLFSALQVCAGQVSEQFHRVATGGAPVNIYNLEGPTTTCFDHITFYKKAFGSTMARGAALTVDELYFQGIVKFIPLDGGAIIGGLLHDSDDETSTLSRVNYTAWSFLDDALGGNGLKMKSRQFTALCDLFFTPMLGSVAEPYELTLADCVNDGFDQGDPPIEYEEAHGVVAKIDWAIRGAIGLDVGSQKISNEKVEGDQGLNVKTLWDNNPALGQKDGSPLLAQSITFSPLNVSFQKAFYQEQSHIWKIYYFDTVAGSSEPVPIVVHDEVLLNTGDGYVELTSTLELPTTLPVGNEDQVQDTIGQIQVILAQQQRLTCLPIAVSMAYMSIYGNPKVTLYRLRLKSGIVGFASAGDEIRFKLPEGMEGYYTLQNLMGTSAVDVADLPGRCWVLQVKPDDESDEMDVELYGLRYAP